MSYPEPPLSATSGCRGACRAGRADDGNRKGSGTRDTERVAGVPVSQAAAVVAQGQVLRLGAVGMAAMGGASARNRA